MSLKGDKYFCLSGANYVKNPTLIKIFLYITHFQLILWDECQYLESLQVKHEIF